MQPDQPKKRLVMEIALKKPVILAESSISTIAEHLAERLGVTDGEVRLRIKASRYDRARLVVSPDALRR